MINISIISFSYKRGLPKDLGEESGRERLHVAFGCTGGQHRSVYCAEVVAGRLRGLSGVKVSVDHTAKEFWKV